VLHANIARERGRCCLRCLWILIAAFLPAPAVSDVTWLPLRNHNPFLQIYGLPLYQGNPVAPGQTRYRASFDIANFADSGTSDNETVTLDGESYFLTFSVRRGVTDWLELGLDLPLIAHTEGSFDGLIKNFHDLIGVSNARRSGPENELLLAYAYPGGGLALTSSAQGIGDLQLTAAVPLLRNDGSDMPPLSLRTTLKVPTGNADRLLGSGGFDLSVALYFSDRLTVAGQTFDIAAFGGMLWLGDSDYFSGVQESTVGFGGVAAAWQATDRFAITSQVVAQGKYLDSAIEEVGANSVQGALGGIYRFPGSSLALSLMFFEDIFGNATADVAAQLALRNYD